MAAVVAKAKVLLERNEQIVCDAECEVVVAKASDCSDQPEDGDKFIIKIETPNGETIAIIGEIAEFTDAFGFLNSKKTQGAW